MGRIPSLAALRSIFCPCSSVPVRNQTSSPIRRRCRATTSATMFSYLWPMCGRPLKFWESLSAYHYLLTISWRRFMFLAVGSYIVTNALFGAGYVLCGEHGLNTFRGRPMAGRLADGFFFSVETVATIGYGNVYPTN